MSKTISIGDRFGDWTVIEINHHVYKEKILAAICCCKCGKISKPIAYTALRAGRSKSCQSCGSTTHGLTGTPEYSSWQHMLDRCENPLNSRYYDYGYRGITVCERWRYFENFLADMGPKKPGYSIERINNDGPYSPDNCCWASRKTQNRNRRSNHLITFKGEKRCLVEWASHFDINYETLSSRINTLKWPIERAFTTPVKQPNQPG